MSGPTRLEVADVPAGRRGRLQLPERVVQRIAAQVASEVAGAGGRSGGVLGLGASTDLGARPKVDVTLAGDSVDLAIEMAASYPVSLRGVAQQVRDHVGGQVGWMTGLRVRRIDIDIIAAGETGRDQEERGLR